jgi:CRISPR-associated endoribonuclease Cas2 subtype I-E
MIIIIAEKTTDYIKGKLTNFFIEIKPNIFLTGIKEHLVKNLIEQIHKKDKNNSFTIIRDIKAFPGYKITEIGSKQNFVNLNGIFLSNNN